MTYIIRSGGHPNKIVGSALITTILGAATGNNNPQVYAVLGDSIGSIGNVRNNVWSIRETTGDFDAVSAYGNVHKIEPNKKILLIGKLIHRGTHSSSAYGTIAWATHTSNTNSYYVAGGNNNTSSLTSYYTPSWKTYPSVNYTTPQEKLPLEANDVPGAYLKRAGIHTFDPSLMYGYMETPSSGNFYLGYVLQARTGSISWYASANNTVDAHSIRIIQFE